MGTSTWKHPSACRIAWPDGRKVVRECRSYRAFFPSGACSWCSLPLDDHPHVDHDHACCDRQDGKCCAACVRGLVHLHCNQEIACIERMWRRGVEVFLPMEYATYFMRRPVAELFGQIELPAKPVRNPYTCSLCSGPMNAQARFGICRRNPQCKREANRLDKCRSRGRA